MEIQQGKGPWASPVNGIVPLGTTLTMVVGIDDREGKIYQISKLRGNWGLMPEVYFKKRQEHKTQLHGKSKVLDAIKV